MKAKRIESVLVLLLILNACSPKRAWEKRAIEKKEAAVMEKAKGGRVDTAGVNDLLKSYEEYAKDYPTDTNGANYLFMAADFYRYMHRPLRSIQLYANIYKNYPDYPKRPYALFLQGFIYENELHNLDSARNKYQSFLTTYPSHPLSRDVQITLTNLGKTPEQLIKEFEEKNKADSLSRSEVKNEPPAD